MFPASVKITQLLRTILCLGAVRSAAPTVFRPHFLAMSSLSTEAAAAPTRGAFILLEGVDRCGKTTQTKLLADALNSAAANPAGTQAEPLALGKSKGGVRGGVEAGASR